MVKGAHAASARKGEGKNTPGYGRPGRFQGDAYLGNPPGLPVPVSPADAGKQAMDLVARVKNFTQGVDKPLARLGVGVIRSRGEKSHEFHKT